MVVVGGGAAGIELSLAMRARWNSLLATSDGISQPTSQLSITLLDSNDKLVPSENDSCRNALKQVTDKYNIEVRHNLVVNEVTSSHVHVCSKDDVDSSVEEIPYTHCIWATGAQAHELVWRLHKQCGLAVSKDRGWILVNEHLQSTSHSYIFAAGDCCEMTNRKSPPKAGVYAVRSGPILIPNLSRAIEGDMDNLVIYQPQDDFLKLLMCGDGTALGFRFGIPLVRINRDQCCVCLFLVLNTSCSLLLHYFSTANGCGI